MKSAFGVEHVEKSLVPKHIGARGGKFIPANQLTSKEKTAMKTNLQRKGRMRRINDRRS